jgi:hypothetical protein
LNASSRSPLGKPSAAAPSPPADLTAAIEDYIDNWNEHAAPFTWTKTADQLIEKITAAKTKTSGHTDH